jgi:hypothetical protein
MERVALGNIDTKVDGRTLGILLRGPLNSSDLFMGEAISGYDAGYNLGDLLHAPCLRVRYDEEQWDARGEFKREARDLVSAQLPGSILARYMALHNHGDPIPSGATLREALEAHFAAVKDERVLSVAENKRWNRNTSGLTPTFGTLVLVRQ